MIYISLGIGLPDSEGSLEGTGVGVGGLEGAGKTDNYSYSHFPSIILPLEIVGSLDGVEVEVGLLEGTSDRQTHTNPNK